MARRYPKGIPKKVVRKIRKEFRDQMRAKTDQGISDLVARLAPRSADQPVDVRDALIGMLSHYIKASPFIALATELTGCLGKLCVDNGERRGLLYDLFDAGIHDVTDLRKFCRKLRAAIPKPPHPVPEEKTP